MSLSDVTSCIELLDETVFVGTGDGKLHVLQVLFPMPLYFSFLRLVFLQNRCAFEERCILISTRQHIKDFPKCRDLF